MSTNKMRKVPRGERRREELVDIAEQIFLEHGFADATMQMIAERAGASKETLYRHFAGKELLFAEIVSRKAAQISGPNAAIVRGGAPRLVLRELGSSLMTSILRSQNAALFRMLVTEEHRTGGLGELFYQRGPGLTVERLVEYLNGAVTRGELKCDDPMTAARLFLGAVVSHYHIFSLINAGPRKLTKAQIDRHLEAAVDMFMARYGTH